MPTMTFTEALSEQRWDDHRYYHHSRINQALHLLSAISFLSAYVLLFVEPAAAVLLAWLVAMPSRQIGHFFFEPKGYDAANDASHDYKEQVKVGYNLRRKVVLMSVWGLSPLLFILSPTLFGIARPPQDTIAFLDRIAFLWFAIGVSAVVIRTVQLFYLRGVQAGLVWFIKILTDPIHDVKLYYKSPAYLLRGEWFDPIVRGEPT